MPNGGVLAALASCCREERREHGGEEEDGAAALEHRLLSHGRAGSLLLTAHNSNNKGELRAALRRAARRRKLDAARAALLDDAAVAQIFAMLDTAASASAPPSYDDDAPPLPRINYDGFCEAGAEAASIFGGGAGGGVLGDVFSARTFLQLERDASGAVPLHLLTSYLAQRVAASRLRVQLAEYEDGDDGTLSPAALEAFVADALAAAGDDDADAAKDAPDFAAMRAAIAARKLLFFHGRRGAGAREPRVRAVELLHSPVVAEMQELLMMCDADNNDAPNADTAANWFSAASARRVLTTFAAWDADGSGGLSRAEFGRIGGGAMTDLFLDRVFEEHVGRRRRRGVGSGGGAPSKHANAGEMDVAAFVDFVLAWDHRGAPAALPYWFAVLDLRHAGALSRADLHAFFRDVHALWLAAAGDAAEPLEPADVLDEMFDMIGGSCRGGLTQPALLASGMAGTLVSLLASADQFHAYNCREALALAGGGE